MIVQNQNKNEYDYKLEDILEDIKYIESIVGLEIDFEDEDIIK